MHGLSLDLRLCHCWSILMSRIAQSINSIKIFSVLDCYRTGRYFNLICSNCLLLERVWLMKKISSHSMNDRFATHCIDFYVPCNWASFLCSSTGRRKISLIKIYPACATTAEVRKILRNFFFLFNFSHRDASPCLICKFPGKWLSSYFPSIFFNHFLGRNNNNFLFFLCTYI